MIKKIKSKTTFVIIIAVAIFVTASALLYNFVTDIHREFVFAENNTKLEKQYSDTLYVGVISRFTPEKIYEGYQPIMDYLTAKTGILFELKLASSYGETLKQLKNGDVIAAFLGSYIFAKENDGTLEAVLKPLNENGESYFRSALIVKENSPIYRVEDLVNKRVALPSAEAFSGNWLQKILLGKFGVSPGKLKEIKHFGFHNSVARQVLMGNYDAGVVKDRVAKEYVGRGLRIVIYSEPIPGSPVVVSQKSDKQKRKILTEALLNAKESNFRNWDEEFAYGFTKARNSDYETLRKIFGGEER